VVKKRIAFIVNHAAFFVSHRFNLVAAAREAGFEVCLFTGQAGSMEMETTAVSQLKLSGVLHKKALFTSSGMNPFIECIGLLQLVWFLIRFRPDIVHCASPKGVLYGGIAARLGGVPALLLAISGMGYAHTIGRSHIRSRAWVRKIYNVLSRFAFNHSNVHVVVQNRDDYISVLESGLANEHTVTTIPGSGVDLSLYAECTFIDKRDIVLLPARMLKDKGVVEFVEAARWVKERQPQWRFILAGAAGYQNPSSIAKDRLLAWQAEGCVEWIGHIEDMTALYRAAAIVCLPSYREGMPKSLLEAAAAGCAVVTTDVAGCRDAIDPGVTGDKVPARDSGALAIALLSLIENPNRRRAYGMQGQKRARKLFSIESVSDKTLDIYKGMLGNA
jgi:glycosyltransferase involved in cell wall biosynthesis